VWRSGVAALGLAGALCSVAVVVSDRAAVLAWRLSRRLTGQAACQARGILVPNDESFATLGSETRGERVWWAARGFTTRVLAWSSVVELLREGKISLGRPIDLDDRSHVEAAYEEVNALVRAAAREDDTLEVVCRGPDPARNAANLRALLRRFVGEDEREREAKARADLKCYRDKLAEARTALVVIDEEIREFNQTYPWLCDSVPELAAELCGAKAEAEWWAQGGAGAIDATTKVRAMDARQKVSELQARLRVAPELLAARGRLQEKRSSAAEVAAEYAAGVRSAERAAGLGRCMGCVPQVAFRVAEWPRPDPAPAAPLRDEIVRTQGIALILAFACLLVLSPACFHVLLSSSSLVLVLRPRFSWLWGRSVEDEDEGRGRGRLRKNDGVSRARLT